MYAIDATTAGPANTRRQLQPRHRPVSASRAASSVHSDSDARCLTVSAIIGIIRKRSGAVRLPAPIDRSCSLTPAKRAYRPVDTLPDRLWMRLSVQTRAAL